MTLNFYGSHYIWFEGIVEDRKDPLKKGRVRVRIYGLHTSDTHEIPTDMLPWANVIMPATSASLSGVGQTPTGIVENTRVVGFFRDGESMQDPLIVGTLHGVGHIPPWSPRSTKNTPPEERKAVYNNGIKDDGEPVEPIKEIERNKDLDINLLVIHCAATKPNMDVGAAEIDSWHKQRGWNKIGYHFVIRRNGVIENGRNVGETGAHAQGYNRKSIGICMVGGIDENGNPDDNFTQAQWSTLRTLVGKYQQEYPGIKVIGHNEVSNKACPSFDVQSWLKNTFPDAGASADEIKTFETDDTADITPPSNKGLPPNTTNDRREYLSSLALIESSGNPNAKAKTSSAAGLYQFTEGTWNETVSEMGKDYTLDDRYDPDKSTEVAAYFTDKQSRRLESSLGREPNNTELYMAHFLGVNGAKTHLNAMEENPSQPADAINPAAAKSNKTIFYNKDGSPRSVQEVYDLMDNKVSNANQSVSTGKFGNKPLPLAVSDIANTPKRNQIVSVDNKFDAGETEAFRQDVEKGSAVYNNNYYSTQNKHGFIDPNGVYPREPYVEEVDTNRLGRNDTGMNETVVQKKKDNIEQSVPTAIPEMTWDEPETPYDAKYPYNHVTETESGHIIEYDDTSGKERIHEYHRTGTFREIHPDGTIVSKIVKDNYQIIAGDDYVLVHGNVNVTVHGDATVKVQGDVTALVNGNVDATVEGNVTGLVWGDVDAEVRGNVAAKVLGNVDATVGGNVDATVSGNTAVQTYGNLELNTSGDTKISSGGDIEISSGGDTRITTGGILYEN